MIRNELPKAMSKLPSERRVIAPPTDRGAYAHHAAVAAFRGRLYATWSSAKRNEDDCGQRVMLSVSEDFEHWTDPVPLLDVSRDDPAGLVLTAGGFYAAGDTLHAYFGRYEYPAESLRENGTLRPKAEDDPGHLGTETGVVSTTDGEHWSAPRMLGLPLVPNHGPQKTRSGRLILAGGVMFPYSDDPSGVGRFEVTGIYGDAFGDARPYDDSAAVELVTRARGWDAKLICEGAFFQTDDDVIHMMLRSNGPVLWCADSFDNGASYTDPYPTGFSDDSSKFHFGRLPDGRFYAVSNPVTGGGRNPLVLSLSQDGELFDTAYILRDEPYEKHYPGMYKGGLYGYPHTLVHDGFLYTIYSKRKEAIEITRVALRDI